MTIIWCRSDVAVALVTPGERTIVQRERFDDRMPARPGVRGVMRHLGFAAAHVTALGADTEVNGASALLAGA